MTEDINQIGADNMRADFLNATTTWARWKLLNRALEWAVAASENADYYRKACVQHKVTPEVTAHVSESWAEGAYDQLFEHWDTNKP